MKQPDTTTIAVLKADRRELSRMKHLTEDGRHEADYELIHRFVVFFKKTEKEYLKGLLEAGIDVGRAKQMTEEFIQGGVVL